jgi:hypothetical protein
VIRTSCEVELALDEFALDEVERLAGRLGVPRARVVARAVRHWLDERASGRLAARPPAPQDRRAGSVHAIPLAVDLPPADWDAVRQAAGAYEVDPERIIIHAVLLLLADLESGRLAARVAGSPDGSQRPGG